MCLFVPVDNQIEFIVQNPDKVKDSFCCAHCPKVLRSGAFVRVMIDRALRS